MNAAVGVGLTTAELVELRERLHPGCWRSVEPGRVKCSVVADYLLAQNKPALVETDDATTLAIAFGILFVVLALAAWFAVAAWRAAP